MEKYMTLFGLVLLSFADAHGSDNLYQAQFGPGKIIPSSQIYILPERTTSLPKVTEKAVVLLTSLNPIKIEAAKALFTRNSRFSECQLSFVPFQTDSSIPDQPLGIETGQLGAYNRILNLKQHPHAQTYLTQPHYICSIENFFSAPEQIKAIDFAYVIVEDCHNHLYEAVSSGVEINRSVYHAALKKGIVQENGCSVTIGSYLANQYGLPAQDWMQEVTKASDYPGLSRLDQILTTLDEGPWF